MKVALALSGGGIRAVAHLGVVEVLLEAGLEIEALSGSSGGALVGAALCDGWAPRKVLELIEELRIWDLFGSRGRGGVFALERIGKVMEERLESRYIEDLPIDFTVACTDLAEGRIHYFDKGPIADLCIASSSLVPVFSPVAYGDLLLADGGFMDNMPTRPLAELDLPVIGVNVNPILPKSPRRIVETTTRALVLMMAANIEASRAYADFYLEPAECEKIGIFDLKKAKEAYEAGRKEAKARLPKLLETLAAL